MSIDRDALAASLRRLGNQAEERSLLPALQQVADACADLFGVTGSGIMLVDQQDISRYVAATDGPGRVLEQLESETGEGPCTEAVVNNRPYASADLAAETERWPRLARAIDGIPVRAVLGVPVRLGAVPVGSLDVYRDHPYEWTAEDQAALVRYGDVVEVTLSAALEAHRAGELAAQLQYALDHRVIIERAVGYLMARERIDALTAFNRLRGAARERRTKLGEVAEELLRTGRLPGA